MPGQGSAQRGDCAHRKHGGGRGRKGARGRRAGGEGGGRRGCQRLTEPPAKRQRDTRASGRGGERDARFGERRCREPERCCRGRQYGKGESSGEPEEREREREREREEKEKDCDFVTRSHFWRPRVFACVVYSVRTKKWPSPISDTRSRPLPLTAAWCDLAVFIRSDTGRPSD